MAQGLIDIHIHGQGGLDVMSGDPKDILQLSLRLRQQGVAGFLPTLITSSKKDTLRALETIKSVWGREKGAKILGSHLEGPFLHPDRKGTHNPKHIRPMDLKEAKEWIAAGEGLVKLVTLAPELPGAGPIIRFLRGKGVRVSMGHTTADWKDAHKAKALGIKSVTHLFNAMNPLHHRDPGLAGFALSDPDLYTEIIADGVHLSDETVKLILRSRPADKVILITDGFFLTKYGKKGVFEFGGEKVSIWPDGSLRKLDGTLSGSNATLSEVVERVSRLKVLPRKKVLAMASTNPLKMLGIRL